MAMFKIKKLLKRSSKCPGPLVQSLPHSILHRIALYTSAFEQSSIRQWEMASSPEITRPLLSMLSVCKNWRAAVMPIFYHTAKLSISADSTHIEPTDDLTHSLSDVIWSKEYTLPRCVVVTVPYAGVFNGSITNLLSSMGYADAVFPEVTELRFNLYSGYYISDDDSAEYDFYTDCFCGYIHAMFPNAQDYHFRVYPFANADDSEMISNVLAGLTQRGAGARVFEYVHSSNMVDISGFQLLTNLTHITFQTDVDRAEYIKLVTQCADTLESVDLQRVKIASAWADLVQDQWGSPIVYPRLRKLSFCVHESSLFHYLDAPEGTPFPSLTHLSVTGGYPYANDILFRGNHKTLENLSIHLDIPKLFLFEEYGVFAKSRYPNLRSMELTGPSENNYVEKALVLKVARIPFEVSSRMQSVKIKLHGWMRGRTILDAIHLSPHVRNHLRVLDIGHVQFTLAQTIELIRLLPNLDSLTCGLMDETQWTKETLNLKNLKYIFSVTCPMGAHLLSFKLGSCAGMTARKALEQTLMLAILFPSLKRLDGTAQIGDRFDGYFSEFLSKPDHWPYSNHLRALEIA